MIGGILVPYIDYTVSIIYEEYALRLISLLYYFVFRHVHSSLKFAHKWWEEQVIGLLRDVQFFWDILHGIKGIELPIFNNPDAVRQELTIFHLFSCLRHNVVVIQVHKLGNNLVCHNIFPVDVPIHF